MTEGVPTPALRHRLTIDPQSAGVFSRERVPLQ